MLLEKYIKEVLESNFLFRESRKHKIDWSKYGHPGLINHALYMHWISCGIQTYNIEKFDRVERYDQEMYRSNPVRATFDYFNNYCIDNFKKSFGLIKNKNELSCNLIDPDRGVGVTTNYSGDGIDPWGYFGFILKPKVVTMGFDSNVGIDFVDTSVDSDVKKMRKRARKAKSYEVDYREEKLDSHLKSVVDKFPLEDSDAYLKSLKKDFIYNYSEFVIVPEEIVGLVFLDSDYLINDSYYDVVEELFSIEDLENLGFKDYDEMINFKVENEKKYLKKFCSENSIKYYESSKDYIKDIPRTSLDL